MRYGLELCLRQASHSHEREIHPEMQTTPHSASTRVPLLAPFILRFTDLSLTSPQRRRGPMVRQSGSIHRRYVSDSVKHPIFHVFLADCNQGDDVDARGEEPLGLQHVGR